MDTNHPNQPVLEYVSHMLAGLAMPARVDRMLFLGLGAGTMPQFSRAVFPQAHIDVVEIDPAMIKIAHDFFQFKEDAKLKVVNENAIHFIDRAQTQQGLETQRPIYDLIFIDTYIGPFFDTGVTSKKNLRYLADLLSESGVVVVNLFSSDLNHFKKIIRLLFKAFRNIRILECRRTSNVICFASQYELILPDIQQRAIGLDNSKKWFQSMYAFLEQSQPLVPFGVLSYKTWSPWWQKVKR